MPRMHWGLAVVLLITTNCCCCLASGNVLLQVGTLNYMSPEAILGGTNNIRGAPPMKVSWLKQ